MITCNGIATVIPSSYQKQRGKYELAKQKTKRDKERSKDAERFAKMVMELSL